MEEVYLPSILDNGFDNKININVKIPEKKTEIELSIDIDAKVWHVKQQIISMVCPDLDEVYNFGLFLPENEKRLGKWMSEDRRIKEYRLRDLPPTIIFKYYCRDAVHGDDRLHKQIGTKLKDVQNKFFEVVSDANQEKATKLLERGLDPNYIHRGSGLTPLGKAAIGKDARAMMLLLCRFGAFLEFRDRNGYTPLHQASINGCHEAIKVLLDAGASVNARDLKGFTPLYNAIVEGNSTYTAEMLLREKCDINVADHSTHWTELHQACKRGKSDLVELLLIYGADINAKSSAGNTALHMCASFNKVDCAKALLARGIKRDVKNLSGQSAFNVAAMTNNLVLIDLINKPADTQPFSPPPTFNNRKKEPVSFSRENSSNNSSHLRSSSGIESNPSIHNTSSLGSESIPRSTSTSSSNTSSVKLIAPEFPAVSDAALGMTMEEIIAKARICKIPKTSRGYGFHVKGLSQKNEEFKPSVEAPCSQFLHGVDADSESQKAGVIANDFIYEVNGVNVARASHREVVDLIKGSGNPLVLKLIQVTNPVTEKPEAPAPALGADLDVPPVRFSAEADSLPPAVPRRDPNTRLQGRPMNRSYTVTGSTARKSATGNQIYANMASLQSPERKPQALRPAPVQRTPSAPSGLTFTDGYGRSNTLPSRPRTAEPQKRDVLTVNDHELREQRKRLNSKDSEPIKPPRPGTVEQIPEEPIMRSRSNDDIARKAEEFRLKRASMSPGEKSFNYDLPAPPTVVPPPPPPEELPPPPPPPENEQPLPSPIPVKSPPAHTTASVTITSNGSVDAAAPLTSSPINHTEDQDSYDSGFVQNGKQVDEWNANDVCEWLAGLGFAEYKPCFLDNDIRGVNLLDLKKDDLNELGVKKLGHRITLTKEIRSLAKASHDLR